MSFIMCIKEELELLNEASDISKIYNTAVNMLKKEMKQYPAFSKGSFKKDNDYKGFINGTEEYTMMYYCKIQDVTRSSLYGAKGTMELFNSIWIPLLKIIPAVNKKLPKEYEIVCDRRGWDEIAIHLHNK